MFVHPSYLEAGSGGVRYGPNRQRGSARYCGFSRCTDGGGDEMEPAGKPGAAGARAGEPSGRSK